VTGLQVNASDLSLGKPERKQTLQSGKKLHPGGGPGVSDCSGGRVSATKISQEGGEDTRTETRT